MYGFRVRVKPGHGVRVRVRVRVKPERMHTAMLTRLKV